MCLNRDLSLKYLLYLLFFEEGLYEPDSKLVVPESFELGRRLIKEAHARHEGETDQVTAAEVLQRSLNVGSTVMAIRLGKERLYKYIKRFGFGSRTQINLPGESSGLLRNPKNWQAIDLGMHSFGQGIGVTSLQLATAMSVVANKGVLLRPRIIKYLSDHEGLSLKQEKKKMVRRVISEDTAAKVLKVMRDGVDQVQSYHQVRVPGYGIAAKTGTAQISGQGGVGYIKGAYVSSVMGAFPSKDPDYVILVSIFKPKGKYYGSSVAGPVFKKIVLSLIDRFNILPEAYD